MNQFPSPFPSRLGLSRLGYFFSSPLAHLWLWLNSSRRSQRGWKFWGLMLACGWLVVACQGGTPTGQSSPAAGGDAGASDRIILGTTSKIRTLDPADSYEILSGNLLYNLGDRLYTNKLGSADLEPQLATALPTISPDGRTYTIPLREGVTFHDGTPFDAKAMAFSLQRFMDNEGQPSFLLRNVVESVAATGDYELTITLKNPFAAFTALLSFPGLCAVSPTAYAQGDQFQAETFVGTGPYRLAAVTPDSVRLDRFEDYWGTAASNSGVDLQIFSSGANLFNALTTGAVDVAYQSLDPDQIAKLQEEAAGGKIQAVAGEGLGIHYLVVNVRSAPLDQKPVRQALASAFDRELLAERVFQNQVQPLYSLVPSLLPSSRPAFSEAFGTGNQAEKALALLKTAGYSPSQPLTIDFWYRSNISSNALAATTLKAMVDERLGGAMVLNLQGVESATAYENLDKGAYPLFLLDWAPDYLDPDNYLEPFLSCEQGSEATGCTDGASQYQGSFFYSDRANTLIQQQRQTQDPAQRQALLEELQTLVADEVPFIPLWANREYLFGQTTIQNLALQPTQQVALWPLEKAQP